ncbi:MAG: hypothetical protein LBQ24_04980 [Candidatus Peribacteria bacterium]|nr:hypothetical protein [Candidatus Peribacteria bacterium]
MYNKFKIFFGKASFFISTITLTHSLFDSSLISDIQTIFLSLTKSAIFSTNDFLFTQ